MRRVTLGEHLEESTQATEDTVREALRDTLRAQELLNVPAFQWWRNRVEKGTQGHYKKLAYADGDLAQLNRLRGRIQEAEGNFRALDTLSERVEYYENRLKEYTDARKQA